MKDFVKELIGNKELIDTLKEEPCYFSVITKINYLINNEASIEVHRNIVFKCIRILKDIQSRLVSDNNG